MKNLFLTKSAVALAALLAGAALATAQTAAVPKVGDKAPLVTGKNQDGKTWKLASSTGKKIVLL